MKDKKLVSIHLNQHGKCDMISFVKNIDDKQYQDLLLEQYLCREEQTREKESLIALINDIQNQIDYLRQENNNLKKEIAYLKGEENND